MFSGKWITAHELNNNMHVRFEKRFALREFGSAKIRITADDYFKLYINGGFVGQGPAPSFSDNYAFNEFDVTDYLRAGENEIAVHCYYQGLINRVWVSGDGICGVIADIFTDGALCLCTDGSWQYRVDGSFIGGKPYGYETAFPENRDMLIEPAPPQNAAEIPCPHRFAKEAFPAPETREISVKPKISGSRYFYDFEQEYVCTPVIKANAKADGARLILHCAEELNTDGSPRFNLRCGCDYEEIITLKKGENRIEQFDYKGLRYIEIICDNAEISEVKIRVQHFPFPKKSQEISTEDNRLSAVWNLCKNTVKYGAQEGFIDCPTREKGQYLGDVFISGFAHYYLTNDARLLKKALCDFADSAEFCNEIFAAAPCAYKQKIADYSLLFAPAVLKYYRLTGDGETAEKLLGVCDKICAHYAQYENENGLLGSVSGSWNLVDWPDNMRDGYQYNTADKTETGTHNVLNAYYIYSLRCTEELRRIFGTETNIKSAEKAAAFNACFLDEERGIYVDCKGGNHSAVHSNILPLAFGICPDGRKEKIADYLEERGMQCSVFMAYFYLWALCNAGRKDAALRFITADGEHGWLNMIKEGATATFEAWGKEQKWNTSLFHPWATAPILIINEHFADMIDK